MVDSSVVGTEDFGIGEFGDEDVRFGAYACRALGVIGGPERLCNGALQV